MGDDDKYNIEAQRSAIWLQEYGIDMEKNTVFKDQLIMNYLDLKVVPTYHCDMNCSYCYNSEEFGRAHV
jgi:sulfatase maturation enzyme AslB (radical SAM superfamily)